MSALPGAHPGIKQHIKGQLYGGLLYGGGELLVLHLHPYVHFLGPALPYAAGGPARIGREPVVDYGIIHNGGQLIVDGLEIESFIFY